jgi:hypothetical protein
LALVQPLSCFSRPIAVCTWSSSLQSRADGV